MSRKGHLRILIANHTRRLQKLKEQQALEGLEASPKLLIEIEDLEAKVMGLQTELEELERVEAPPQAGVTDTTSEQLSIPKSISGVSPFICGGAVPPDQFYGRQDMLRIIARRIDSRTLQSISIVGERRIGKSSLLHYVVSKPETFLSRSKDYVFIYLDLMKGYCHTRSNLFKTIRRELQKSLHREPWSPDEDGDLGAFDFAIEDIVAQGKSLVLCLDQVENLTRRPHEFDEILEDWRANGQMGQIAMVTSSTQSLAHLCSSGGLISPFFNIFIQETLGLLTQSEWQTLVCDQFDATEDDLLFIDKMAGGHPFFTQMAAEILWYAYQNGIVDYDKLSQDLYTQMQPHLASLWRSLSPLEQSALSETAMEHKSITSDKRILSSLQERGLIRDNRPFSQLFIESILSGQWN